jgi:hypothetical protein
MRWQYGYFRSIQIKYNLDDNAEVVEHKCFVVPQLTETCILGIEFITENALVLDRETCRVTYKIKGKTVSLIADTGESIYAYSPLIQFLNATVANTINKQSPTQPHRKPPFLRRSFLDCNPEKNSKNPNKVYSAQNRKAIPTE